MASRSTAEAPAANPFADAVPVGTHHVIATPVQRLPRGTTWLRVRRVKNTSVVPVDAHGYHPVLVPAHLPKSCYQVAEVVAHEMSVRRGLGMPYGVKLACGQHWLSGVCADFGYRLSPTTVYRALQLLDDHGVLARIGELDPATDPDTGRRHPRGAHVYAPSSLVGGGGPTTSNAPLLFTGGWTRLDRCLKWAIENADVGQRNEIGRWLTWRSTDAGLDEAATMAAMRTYQERVPQPAGHRYTWTEARATVRSRFRRLARTCPQLAA